MHLNWLWKMLSFRSSQQTIGHPRDPALAAWFGAGDRSTAGEMVNEYTALNLSTFWACVRVISESVASLPFFVYERLPGGGKQRYADHPSYRLIHDSPNAEMTAMAFRETLTGHLLTWGNCYAEIERSRRGLPFALHPLTPDRVRPRRLPDRLVYDVSQANGSTRTIEAADILHIAGLGFDGLIGYSVVRMAKESIGLGLAAEQFGAAFFGNGAIPKTVIEHPGELGEKGAKTLKDSFNAVHQGSRNSNSIAVLEEGATLKSFSVPPDDAQFLETRRFQVEDIARWFRVPPHKIGHLEKATFSNIEQQSLEFVTDTLRPWLVRWEQEINRKLFEPGGDLFCEHLVDGLLRGDIQSRYTAYATGRQWGWLSVDDIRERENMNPLPDDQGKTYLVPMNMQPADKINEPPPAPAPATPPANEPPPIDPVAVKQQAALRSAIDGIFADAVTRMLTKESNAATRAAKSPKEFMTWLDKFYADHEILFRSAILPACHAAAALIGKDAEAMAAELAAAHVARSRESLLEAAGTATAVELPLAVERTVQSWDQSSQRSLQWNANVAV